MLLLRLLISPRKHSLAIHICVRCFNYGYYTIRQFQLLFFGQRRSHVSLHTQILVSSHTSSLIPPTNVQKGTITLLFQDSTGGLEVEDPLSPGSFNPVTPISGTVLVNVGDLMERWSNGRWRSTVHRVVAPPVDESASQTKGEEVLKPRYSIPFFATADPDTVIDALPGCWDEMGNLKKYEATTAWGYVQMRMAALYS